MKTRGANFPGNPRPGDASSSLPVLLLLLLLLFAGCARNDQVAGGDDFPNSVETLGKSAAEEGGDSTEWNAYNEAPSSPPEVYDSTHVSEEPPGDSSAAEETSFRKSGLVEDGRVIPGRDIAGAVRTVIRIPDTGGVTRAVRVQVLAALDIVARDTTWYRTGGGPPAQRVLRVSGAVTYPDRTERFVHEDADGDGVLTPVSGGRNLSRARFAVTRSSGRVEEREVLLAAGPDLSFRGRADNILRSVTTVHRNGEDTLLRIALRPVEGDSVVFDPARDSTRVEVEHVLQLDSGKLSRFYQSVVFADPARNHPRRFRRVLETPRGITETILLGRDSLPRFSPGDTGRVIVSFTSSLAADSLQSSRFEYRVLLSDTAGRFGSNRLLRVDREKTFRFGARTGLRYRLWPSAPVPDGEVPRTGGVEMRVDLRSGGWIGFVGEASASGFSGTWTDASGDGGTVHFDASGSIVTAPPFP